tara:strand:+ start:147 stop:818 length:672 start_codon:yes stop_codon:yes gene_type:complete
MNWKKYWDTIAINNPDNKISQVQRKDEESTFLTVNHIIRILDITRVDKVLDVCCGNGIITCEIAKKCESIIGVDQSENLLKTAKTSSKELNIDYINGSVLKLSELLNGRKFDKIYMQFSFQYFDKKNQGDKVISELLKCLNPMGKIFIGDIPECDKFPDYYNSVIKKLRFYKDRLLLKNEMGKFWKVSELKAICLKNDVKGTYLIQPKELPYSYYRFDYLIEN